MSVPEPVLGDPLAESAIAVSPTIDVPATHEHAQSRSVVGARGWLLTAFLFLVPLVAFWPATFHDYGLRDDYSNLREAHEEVGILPSTVVDCTGNEPVVIRKGQGPWEEIPQD